MSLPDVCFSMPRGRPAAPERYRTFRGRAAVSRPPHTAALGAPGERTGAASQPGERGVWKGASRGWVARSLGKKRIAANGRVSVIFGGVSLPGSPLH